MKKLYFILLFLAICQRYAYTQTTVIDWQKELKNAKHDTARLKCYIYLGYIYTFQNIDSAYLYLEKGKQISTQYPNHYLTIKLWSAYGNYYSVLPDNSKTIYYYEKCKNLAFVTNDQEYKITASLNLIQHKYLYKNDYIGTIKALLDFKTLLDPVPNVDRSYYFYYYNNLSICYENLKKPERQMIALQKSLEYATNETEKLVYYANLCQALAKDKKKISKTIATYSLGVQLAKKLDDHLHILGLHIAMSAAYINSQQYDLALQYNRLAEQEEKNNNFIDQRMTIKANYGQIYHALHQYTLAKKYLDDASPFFRQHGIKNELLSALKIYSSMYAATGNYKKAYQYGLEASKLEEEIASTEKQIEAVEIENQQQIKEKEKAITVKEQTIKSQKKLVQVEQRQKNITVFLLAIAFVAMLWALWNYYKQNKLRIKVDLQAQELSKVNKAKDKLFAMLGHDLRTPVSRLISAMNIEQNTDESFQKKRIKIKNELENVQLILNNLLHWAGLQIKNIQPQLQKISLKELIKEAIDQLETTAHDKGIGILNQTQDVTVLADESQAQIVLRNVLSNAIKFSHTEGYIKVSSRQSDNKITLSIQDTGICMTNEQTGHVFDLPAPQRGTANEKGTGIGLNMCKELIEKNGGSINISSTLGKGTKVDIVFVAPL